MENMNWEELIKNIPPGSRVFVWGTSLLSKLIRMYQRWDTGKKETPTHEMVYMGSGKRECISAEALGVRTVPLDNYKKYRIEIYSYKTLTVEQLQRMKDYGYGTVGRNYDYLGLFAFLGKIIKRKLPQSRYANFCSENTEEIFLRAEIKTSDKPVYEQHPAEHWLKVVENPTEWKNELIWKWEKK